MKRVKVLTGMNTRKRRIMMKNWSVNRAGSPLSASAPDSLNGFHLAALQRMLHADRDLARAPLQHSAQKEPVFRLYFHRRTWDQPLDRRRILYRQTQYTAAPGRHRSLVKRPVGEKTHVRHAQIRHLYQIWIGISPGANPNPSLTS